MENEIIEENILETPQVPLEGEESSPVIPQDNVPDTEVVEDVPETPADISQDENIESPSGEEDLQTGTENTVENGAQADTEDAENSESTEETGSTEDAENSKSTEETGSTEESIGMENEEIVYMEDGSEDFYSTLSGNDAMGDGSGSSGDTYVTNYYEIVGEEPPLLWDSNISELSSTDMLLFMIFLLLLVQFIHNLFKGSHWFKG